MIRIGHLLPELMNIYADRGNVECLLKRCQWRSIPAQKVVLRAGCRFGPEDVDIVLIGGGQDRQQQLASRALAGPTGASLRACVEDGVVLLAVCGGYQLMGHSYRDFDGRHIAGMGLLELETVHPGPGTDRCIGNIAVDWTGQSLIGFENHGGRTYLAAGQAPLGRVEYGHGNNSEDGTEGARSGNVFGTYLHGSLLPKNPRFADHLLGLALARNGCRSVLTPLDDRAEWAAHASAQALISWQQTAKPRRSN